MKKDLSFLELRQANIKRLPQFKNNKGEIAHSKRDGSDWSLNDWMVAVQGEVGEAANLLKKVRRGDYTLTEVKEHLASEFADIILYLDILAKQAGIDLGEAVINTFNAKSAKVGSDIKLIIKL